MSRFKNSITFFWLLLISAVVLLVVGLVQNKLDDSIKENHLRFTGQIKNAPPLVAFTTVAMGSFRGILADLLWLRAHRLQDKGNYFEMVQLANWITKLQPRFSGATAYLAWNMAYNISVTCSSFADRWRWVNEGVKLIRDEALLYNPEDASLYKELGWIFQHKMGNIMDDANLYYKNKLAISIARIIGQKPDWHKLAAAPADYAGFLKKYPENDKNPFWKALGQSGIENYASLYLKFKENEGNLPAEFLKALNNPEIAKALKIYFDGQWLRDKYKLDPKLILEINNKYGNLDWRLPEAQAIYWATLGLRKTPSHKDLSCERMITQSLFSAFKSGRLLYLDKKDFRSIVCIPNLNVVDSVLKTYEDAYIRNNKQTTFRSAKINFMKDAIVILYNFGSFSKARNYYKKLRQEEPGKYRRPMESFVMRQWAEDVRDASVKKATDVISGLIYRSINFLVLGEDDAALANENIARYIYSNYQRSNADIKDRVGLAPFSQIKASVTEACLQAFPPLMKEILKQKIAEEKQGGKKSEEGDGASSETAKQ
ncbi:hypothetical protein P0136_01010 [Lentisphaerota bacterium ZTH]|nr:hypothetical protein JYG24_07850 [Lentisphaerota bacterium]WET06592.1 hypothetical protein P0136_01010 [Lentisphaerota bacterium ZTH]